MNRPLPPGRLPAKGPPRVFPWKKSGRSSRAIRLVPAIAALAAVLSAVPACALWRAEGEGGGLDIGGSVRTTAAGFRNYSQPLLFGEDNGSDGASQTSVRLTAAGWAGERLTGEVHAVQTFSFATRQGLTGGVGGAGWAGAPPRYRVADARWDWTDDEDASASLAIDRFSIAARFNRLDLTVGRQAVNFAQAYFWNPLDVFLPFDPQAFDRDYKPGVDALRLDVQLGPFSGATLVAAAGREIQLDPTAFVPAARARSFRSEPWYGSALLGRWFGNVSGWDISLQTGKVHGGALSGAGCSGEIGPFGVRGEAAYFTAAGSRTALLPDPDRDGAFRSVRLVRDEFNAVLGIDRRFASSVYFNAEYFYNGGGEPQDMAAGLVRAALGQSQHIGRHYLGGQLSYELHPLLTGGLGVIQSFSDQSTLITGSLSYSVADEADAALGFIAGRGERPRSQPDGSIALRSEFGMYPAMIYAEFKVYLP